LISTGKDKKIKIWDWIKQKLINTLLMHDDSVESIVLSNDEKLLFSGSQDKKVGVWSMEQHFLITTLSTTFPIRTLTLSSYGDYLLATSKSNEYDGKCFAYWPI
jgi:WD40 repeat protein